MQQFIYRFEHNLTGIFILITRYLLDFLVFLNDTILLGLFDQMVEKSSRLYNGRLISYQLERIDKGLDTGLKVLSFDMGHGCWIATVLLDPEITKDPRAEDFVTNVVSYTTHTERGRINTTLLNENQVKIVVNDQRIE